MVDAPLTEEATCVAVFFVPDCHHSVRHDNKSYAVFVPSEAGQVPAASEETPPPDPEGSTTSGGQGGTPRTSSPDQEHSIRNAYIVEYDSPKGYRIQMESTPPGPRYSGREPRYAVKELRYAARLAAVNRCKVELYVRVTKSEDLVLTGIAIPAR